MANWENMATELYVDNHNWLSTDITDFASAVTAFRLDQFALPTANLNLNGQRWINSAAPVDAQDLTTKQWVLDSISGSALSVVGTTNQINVNLANNTATVSIADNPIFLGALAMTGDIISNTNSSGVKTAQSILLTKSGVSNLPTIYFGPGSNGLFWDGSNLNVTNSLLPTVNNSINLGSNSFNWANLFTNGATINGLTASQAVVTNASKQLTSLGYSTSATASTLAQRDASGNLVANAFNGGSISLTGNVNTNGITTTSLTVSGLTASQAVVTNASKQLASLGYSTSATANSLVQRDASGNINASAITGTSLTLYGDVNAYTIFGQYAQIDTYVNALGFIGRELTASQAVVTNASKQLASLAYSTSATASTLAQRDASGNLVANAFNGTSATINNSVVVRGSYASSLQTYYIGFGGQTTWDLNIQLQSINAVWAQARCPGWNTYSSKKLKDNISSIKGAMSLLDKIEGVEFTWKEGQGDNVYHPTLKKKLTPKKQIGFIAEDVYKVLPSVCVCDENEEATSMDYSKLVPLLVQAIKELNGELKKLKTSIQN